MFATERGEAARTEADGPMTNNLTSSARSLAHHEPCEHEQEETSSQDQADN